MRLVRREVPRSGGAWSTWKDGPRGSPELSSLSWLFVGSLEISRHEYRGPRKAPWQVCRMDHTRTVAGVWGPAARITKEASQTERMGQG